MLENLEKIELLYREVCQKINNQTISSYDFFSAPKKIDFSFVSTFFNVNKHGRQEYNNFLTYFAYYAELRELISERCKKFTLFSSEHKKWIKYLTLLEMGIGESDVLTYSFYYHLLKHHLEQPFYLLEIVNAQNNHYKHHLIVISQDIPKKGDHFTETLHQLPKETIIIDPLHQFVNWASMYLPHHQTFIDNNHFIHISQVTNFSPLSIEEQQAIESHVHQLINQITLHRRESRHPIEESRKSIFPGNKIEILDIMNLKRRPASSDEQNCSSTAPTFSC